MSTQATTGYLENQFLIAMPQIFECWCTAKGMTKITFWESSFYDQIARFGKFVK